MLSGPKPSTDVRGAASGILEAARGSVRDSLGAIRNVEQLLKSIKVGPKALGAVIPDVHASCAPLLVSFRELLNAVADLGEAPLALEAFIAPRIDQLERALRRSLSGPLNAKQRLSLESAVSRVAGDLDAARELVELLEGAMTQASVPVQLVEVVREATKFPEGLERLAEASLMATLEAEPVEVKVNPRVATGLTLIATALVVERHPGRPPHIVVGRGSDGRREITVRQGSGQGETLNLLLPRIVAPTLICAQASARATGGTLELAPDGSQAVLSWMSSE